MQIGDTVRVRDHKTNTVKEGTVRLLSLTPTGVCYAEVEIDGELVEALVSKPKKKSHARTELYP